MVLRLEHLRIEAHGFDLENSNNSVVFKQKIRRRLFLKLRKNSNIAI
jgi:hypothetical protein